MLTQYAFACTVPLALVAPAPIVIDGALDDWAGVVSAPGDAGANDAFDPVAISAAHDDTWLFLRIEFVGEVDIEESNQVRLRIDADNDASTGSPVEALGVEVAFRFGERFGFRFDVPGTPQIRAPFLSLRGGPSVDSRVFEFAIARAALNTLADGPTPRVRVMVRNETTMIRVPAGGSGLLYEFDGVSPPLDPAIPLERGPDAAVRLATHNLQEDGPWDEGEEPRFGRQYAAVDADVWCFQEIYNHTGEDAAALLRAWADPGPSVTLHHAQQHDCITVSRFPILGTWTLDNNLAVLLDTTAELSRPLLVVNAHMPCCQNNSTRQAEIDRIMAFVRDAQATGVGAELTPGTPFVIAGDLNLVGRLQQLTTLLTGDIVDEAAHGADFAPDWNGADLVSVRPRHNADRMGYTWRSDGTDYWPGHLDYIIYSSSAIDVVRSFVLETQTMSEIALGAAGLSADDSAAADHRLFVVDLRIAPCPSDPSGDGLVNSVDLALLLASWGQSRVREDINLNGVVNSDDLAFLLAAWGPCPP